MSIKSEKISLFLLILLFSVFFALFIYKSFVSMINIPFNEFDEAHRAENAKQMKEYNSFFVPLSGSNFDRNAQFQIPFKNNSFSSLYYHLERPPLVYSLMVFSTNLFGSIEWVYRLPSFIMGMLSFLIFLYFSRKFIKNPNIFALSVGLVSLVTSADLWLSSQYAQLDTGFTSFLFIALLSLIYFCESKRNVYLILSSLGLALGILCKGQPAIIFTFPILYLVFTKKLAVKQLIKLIFFTFIFICPWLLMISLKFGFFDVVKVFFNFAIVSAVNDEIFHLAPFFWYARWWWETLRPGWSLFIALFIFDLFHKSLDWRKKTLLFYILGGLITLSIPHNKLWWYVLPLIPPLSFYTYLSITDFLKNEKNLLFNLSLAILIASRAPLVGASNKVAMFYGIISALLMIYILTKLKISLRSFTSKYILRTIFKPEVILFFSIIFSLVSFYIRFPQIIPYHWNIKPVASYFSTLPGIKCLWIYDMPPESALFYSNAGEIHQLTANSKPFGYCNNYLMTPAEINDKKLIFKKGNMKLFSFEDIH